MDIDGCRFVNVEKSSISQLTLTAILVFPYPCLNTDDFNCQRTDWGYSYTNSDGECLADWAAKQNFSLLYNPKDVPSFFSGRGNNKINPNLAFPSENSNSSELDRRTLKKFPRSQHRP